MDIVYTLLAAFSGFGVFDAPYGLETIMSVTASLTRRNFVLAAAAASLAALPALALAEEKKDEKAAAEPKGADVEGTWVMIAVDCDDEETLEVLALLTILATTTYELKADGTGTFKVAMIDGSDAEAEAAAEGVAGESVEQAEGEVNDQLQNTEAKVTWEQVSDTELVVTTEDGEASNFTIDGLSLVNVENAEGMEITSIFARAKDVLSGAWAFATYPDQYDAKHEGIVGSWTLVAMEGMGENELDDAKWSALLSSLGISVTIDVAEDGTFALTEIDDPESDPSVVEGTWTEKSEDTYTFDADSEAIDVKIIEGALHIEVEGMKMVLVPLAKTTK